MTPTQIAEARALVDATTPGPWREQAGDVVVGGMRFPLAMFDLAHGADARFVAWCREGVPALIDALEAQTARAEAAELREAGLLATNETERQTLIRHNAAHAAQVADLTRVLLKCRPIASDLARSWAAEAVLLGQIDAAIKSGGA